ncbi:MAG: PDGLE domain-containing protein [Candidatus Bathyarchaeales archaeon]
MRGLIKALVLMLIGFALLTPFASPEPDGLEKVAETLKIEEPETIWTGLMPDYTLPTVGNPYLSTVFAGFLGVFLVLCALFVLGKVLAKSDN